MLIIGLTVGHDASVSISDDKGKILYAAAEERFSRVKGHLGAPYSALKSGIKYLNLSVQELSTFTHVIAGSINSKNLEWFYLLLLGKEYQGKFDVFNSPIPPGLLRKLKQDSNKYPGGTDFKFQLILEENLGYKIKNLISINHHDAHAASAYWASTFQNSLVITLDGSGDGESGTVRQLSVDGGQKLLKRIPEKFSLGHLYSEVTKRYGFKESRHEGKITGLVALSKKNGEEIAFEKVFKRDFYCGFNPKYLFDYRLRDPKNLLEFNHRMAFKLAVARTEQKLTDFPDLAKSVQNYLQDNVLNLIKKFSTGKSSSIALAGGVFSNVLLNGEIREAFKDCSIYVYPNMGDGGLSTGAIWEYLRLQGQFPNQSIEPSMYIGSDLEKLPPDWNAKERTPKDLADELFNGTIIGFITGRMEYGPRALCHRSILATPTNANINRDLNLRLNRTEFMPFAPVIRDIDFDKVFCDALGEKLKYITNFRFMTETCYVRSEYLKILPAIVHVDGTARPQILRHEDNPFLYETLGILANNWNIPAIINTSFNAHEEPIIENIYQAKNALIKNQIDKLYVDKLEIFV